MPDPVWYKSLYWRIAFGFVAMLAALLLAQGLVGMWLTDRIIGTSAQSPEELVSSVASNLSAALSRDPGLAIDTYVRDEFRHIYRPFVVAMNDGRAVSNRPNSLPPGYIRAVQQRVRRGDSLTTIDPGDGPRDRGPGGGRGGATAAPANPRAGASRGTDHATPVHRSSRRRKLTPAVDRARRDVDRRPRRSSSRMLRSDPWSSRSTHRQCLSPFESSGRR